MRLFGIKIGDRSVIHSGVRFFTIGKISIGDESSIGPGCYLDARKGIKIGNRVNISHDTKIYTLGHDVNDKTFSLKGGAVSIDDYACVFANVLVMPNVHIKRGAVVYPGSVVTKDVPEYSIVGGNPARVIGVRNRDLDYNVTYDYWFPL